MAMPRVLVVDDHEENLYLLRALLGGHGIEVIEAGNGAEALEKARLAPPDLVISDLLMPVMDGYTLLRHWKEDPALRASPFVVYTATYTEPKDETLARALGADEFIVKPAEPAEFMERLRTILGRAERGELAPTRAPAVDDESSLKLYNEVLIAKLEQRAQQLEQANRQLCESERLYRALFLSNPNPMWVYDVDTLRFLAVNDAAIEHYGYSREEFLAMTIADIRPVEDVPRLVENVARVADRGFDRAGTWRHRRADGSLIDVEITSHLVDYFGVRGEVVAAHDITARLQAEQALARRNRLYLMLSHTNELLVRATDRRALLDGVCRVAVEHGGFRFVWLGLLDEDRQVRVEARAGDDRGYIDSLALVADGGDPRGGSPTLRALIEGTHAVSNDFLADPAVACRHEAARHAGFRASAAFPLRLEGKVVGSLNLYADEVGFFGADELATLDEIVVDVGFGLVVLERNRLLRAASHVVEASPVVLFRWSTRPGWPVEFVSSNIARWGYAADELTGTGRPFAAIVHPDDAAHVLERAALHAREGGGELIQTFRIVTAGGDERWVECTTRRVSEADDRLQGTVADVTERETAVQALRDSERTLRLMMDTLHVGVWLMDASGRIVMANRAGQRIWAGARYVGVDQFGEYKGWWSDTGEPIGAHDWAAARAVEKGEVSLDEVIDIQCFDGTRKTILNSAVPLHDEQGAIRGAIIVNHDITDRRAADLALAASERRFHATFEQAAVGVAHVAPNGNWLEVNRRLCEIVDYGREELLGMSFQDLTHPDDLDRDLALAGQVLAGELRTYSIEKRYIRKDRKVVWVNLTVSLVRKPDGSPDYFVSVVEDITARRRVEDDLRKLSQAVEQAAESLIVTDAAGRIEYVNRSFSVVSGYSREELVGRNPRILQSGRTPRETYERMWATLSAGDPWSGEFVNRRKDGSEYTEAVNISPVRQADGTITHYVAVKEDITERRRNEQELERYRQELEALVEQRTVQLGEALARAEDASKAKSAFLANMSHEIRTPMNGVLGMLEILERGELTRQQADLVQVARDSGRTLLGIIDDILDLSKIEAGRIQIVPEETGLTELVEGLCDSLLPVAARGGVRLSVFVDPALPERVLTDPLRLRQILFNLIGNAIKFSGGRHDTVGRVRLRVARGPETGSAAVPVTVAVVDNGIGMTPEETSRLFQPFTQAEATTTRRFGGTGLGLTICRRLVDLMGGCIEVASEHGVGTTFTLSMPMQVATVQPPSRRATLDGVRCVLVESAALEVEALDAYLRAAGARVERSPDQALLRVRGVGARDFVEIRYLGPTALSQEQIVRWPGPSVLITGGRRRRLRPEAPGVVTLDAEALRRDEFVRAVAVAAGRLAVDERSAVTPNAVLRPPSLLPVAEARARGELILVAEDDEINRRVIARQLELLGRSAEIAHDGAEALAMWREGSYALLLTDLHMPELDGYAMTRAIRTEEKQAGRPPMPVLALTANAMRGEAEQARELGMNEYLVKPLQLEDLRRAIDRWLPASPGVVRPLPVFDPAVLRSLVGDDPQAVRDLLEMFRKTLEGRRRAFLDACGAHDAEAAGQVAHKLKSSARSVGALALGRLCGEAERVARAGDRVAIHAIAAEFEAAVAAAASAIDAWLKGEGR